MHLVRIHDRARLAIWLRSNVAMNAFALCDGDPAQWNHTMWFGLCDGEQLHAVALSYFGLGENFVNVGGNRSAGRDLLRRAADLLPRSFHLSLEADLNEQTTIEGRTLEHVQDFRRMPGSLRLTLIHVRRASLSSELRRRPTFAHFSSPAAPILRHGSRNTRWRAGCIADGSKMATSSA